MTRANNYCVFNSSLNEAPAKQRRNLATAIAAGIDTIPLNEAPAKQRRNPHMTWDTTSRA